MLDELYHCSECKKIVNKIEDLYFVEDGSPRGFCTEQCIEKYYAHMIKHFEEIILAKKKELKLPISKIETFKDDPHFVDGLLKDPDEIWKIENKLKEEYFVFLKKSEETGQYLVVLCFVFNFQPSFIILLESTKSEELVNMFRVGERVEDISVFKTEQTDNVLDQEVLEEVEQKKSTLLAELLEKRLETDIPFESFMLYEEYFDITLHDPDEMFSHKDQEGDEIIACIKAFDKEGVSFYYFVLCIHVGERMDNVDSSAIFPVLGFPSLDGNIYKSYHKGTQISGHLKN